MRIRIRNLERRFKLPEADAPDEVAGVSEQPPGAGEAGPQPRCSGQHGNGLHHDWMTVKSLRNHTTNRNITIGLAEKIFLSVPVSLFLIKLYVQNHQTAMAFTMIGDSEIQCSGSNGSTFFWASLIRIRIH
jgi:hypothetical protein